MKVVPAEIKSLIDKKALFVINDSAGKDSQAMKIKLISIVPKDQLVIVHANLPEVEWPGNLEHIKRYSQGVSVYEVRAKKTFFEMVEHRKKFPSPQHRQCTSDLKRGPIQKFINTYAKAGGFSIVVNCLGLRAEESPARKRKSVFQYKPSNSSGLRTQYEWLPIHNYTRDQVLNSIREAGQELHWAYKEGMTRLSCCFCIMASKKDLQTAARLNPQLAEKYIETEERLNFTMSMSGKPLKEIFNTKIQ